MHDYCYKKKKLILIPITKVTLKAPQTKTQQSLKPHSDPPQIPEELLPQSGRNAHPGRAGQRGQQRPDGVATAYYAGLRAAGAAA